MARFRNLKTGAVVNVDDSKAGRFSPAEWEPADGSAPRKTTAKKAPAKKAAAKRSAAKTVLTTDDLADAGSNDVTSDD